MNVEDNGYIDNALSNMVTGKKECLDIAGILKFYH